MSLQKVVLLPVCYKMQLQTDGTGSYSFIDLDLPDAANYGPYVESVIAYTSTENRTTNIQIVSYWSIDGRNWSTAVDLFSVITGNGNTIQTAFTTASALGPIMRYAIAVANGSGSAIERGVVTASLAFTFKS
jgi:hypothetical protein